MWSLQSFSENIKYSLPSFCSIPLPPWVLEEISKNPDLVYTDRSGRRNPEYISLGCDSLPVLRGRTPIQVYSDYMRNFRERFKDYLGEVISVRLLLPFCLLILNSHIVLIRKISTIHPVPCAK